LKGAMGNVGKRIERTLGLSGVIIISLSAMLGSGLFVLPSMAADLMGDGMWLAYVLAATVVLPGAISKSEMASALPVSGGTYVYVERTYGPLIGTVTGLGLWASFLLKAAFALIGLSAYMYAFTSFFDMEFNTINVSLSVLVLVVVINILGVKKIKSIQTPIVASAVVFLLLLSIAALFMDSTDLSRPGKAAFNTDSLLLAETAALVFVAYAGVTKVAAIAGEIKNPGQNLPNGMYLSLLFATVLYAGVAYVLMAALPDQWWIQDGNTAQDPIYIFATHVGGQTVGLIAALLAIFTMASMALAGILASSRYLFAMSRDSLLPQFLEDLNPKWETPHWAIIITGMMMAFAILFLPVYDVAKLASGFQIMVFIVINSCVIVLRQLKTNLDWYEPTYKGPFYPFIQIWGIVAGVVLIVLMGEKAFIGAGVAILVGMITYFGYGKKHAHPRETPFETFRKQFTNPSKSEHNRRISVFHAADLGGKNHLTLREFQHALGALDFKFNSDESRLIFHKSDINGDGFVDIDEFITTFENDILEEE
jgi:APA family basic amino acid/polyamine antiporter